MDIELGSADLAFQEEVLKFLDGNAYKPGTDYNAWRMDWFASAKDKGGWDVPKWPTEFGGPGWSPSHWPGSSAGTIGRRGRLSQVQVVRGAQKVLRFCDGAQRRR